MVGISLNMDKSSDLFGDGELEFDHLSGILVVGWERREGG